MSLEPSLSSVARSTTRLRAVCSVLMTVTATNKERLTPMSESCVSNGEQSIYESPGLVEVGDFAEMTLGTVGQVSDDGAFRDN